MKAKSPQEGAVRMAAEALVRDRIKKFDRIAKEQFVPMPENFRQHPEAQREALRAILRTIGFAGAVLAREMDDGRFEIIDGHMRVDEAKPGQKLPTLVLDVNAEEARTLMALYDPLGDLAQIDSEKVQAVLDGVAVNEDALQVMLLELSGYGRESLEEVDGKAEVEKVGPPGMQLRPYEHYDYVVVLARTTMDWQALCAKLGLERVDSAAVPGIRKIGLGRCIDAGKLLEKLGAPRS